MLTASRVRPWCFTNLKAFYRAKQSETGNEAEYVLVSVVRTSGAGFLNLRKRVNVMLTRCTRGMVVVTNRRFLASGGYQTLVGELARHWESRSPSTAWVDWRQVLQQTVDLPGTYGENVTRRPQMSHVIPSGVPSFPGLYLTPVEARPQQRGTTHDSSVAALASAFPALSVTAVSSVPKSSKATSSNASLWNKGKPVLAAAKPKRAVGVKSPPVNAWNAGPGQAGKASWS
jgi:hypothetical protein